MRAGGGPESPLRVLHVLAELRQSGAEMMLLSAMDSMTAAGVESSFVSTGDEVGALAGELAATGAVVIHRPFRRSPWFLVGLVMLGRRFDVVHVHTERASFWLCAGLRVLRIPVVRTIHSSFLFTGRLRTVRAWQRGVLRRAGVAFVSIGREVADNERLRFGLVTQVVPNWVDPRFAGAALSQESSAAEPLIVSVGNCAEPKNHEGLLRAVALVANQGVPVRYRHVGAECGAVVDERGLAVSLGCSELVDFVGPSDPLQHLRDATVFVMPSTREGFGLAALEALSAGAPTLLTDAPGLREFSEVPGVWWSAPDAESLAHRLEEILAAEAAERASRAAGAAAYVAMAFDGNASRLKMLRLYQSLARTGP
jgi:glycosyltransferase involved in cell wall biosynthesis